MRAGWLLGLALMMQFTDPVTSLTGFRGKARPLLIFADTQDEARCSEQTKTLATHVDELRARQVVGMAMTVDGNQPGLDRRIWATFIPAQIKAERRHFHVAPHSFVVILIGKDGGEKKRWTRPVSFEELRAAIDAMPGRQDEMRQAPAAGRQ